MENHKTCKKCDTQKTNSEFYLRDATCKECRKAAVRANRSANIEHYRAYDRTRANNSDRALARKEYLKTDAGKAARSRATKINRTKTPEQVYARSVLSRAIHEWGMKRPENCQHCGCECVPHGHHDDYSKPLDVIWLCAACHTKRHKELKSVA